MTAALAVFSPVMSLQEKLQIIHGLHNNELALCMWLLPQPLNSPIDRQLMALSDSVQHHWTIREKCLRNGVAHVQFMDLVLKWPKRKKLVLIYQQVSEAVGTVVSFAGHKWKDWVIIGERDSRVQMIRSVVWDD